MAAQSEGQDSIKVVQAWLDAWAKRDLERMKAIAADDFIQWHATIRKELSKDEEFEMLSGALKVLRIQFKDIKLTALNDGVVLQQCVGDITIDGAGSRENVPFAMVYKTRNGKLVRCDEYMDGMSLPPMDFTPDA